MSPTLEHGNWIVVDRFFYFLRRPQVGDIILIQTINGEFIVKRIALTDQSDLIWYEERLYLPEYSKFISLPVAIRAPLFQANRLPTQELFILGDNMPISYDSRVYGMIHQEQIIGKVIGVVLP